MVQTARIGSTGIENSPNIRKNKDEVMGRTRQGRQVFFPGDISELKGELVMVEIVEARTWSLVGKIVDK